jgi:hypothetical protein
MNIATHSLFAVENPKKFKVYFVEIDDDNRERVISAVVHRASLELKEDYADVHSMDSEKPFHQFRTSTTAELNLELIEQDGILFKHETWEDEEEQ